MIRLLLALAALLMTAESAGAKVFYAKDEALRLAFGDADRIEARPFFLTPAQVQELEARSGSRLDSKLLTIHVGRRGGEILGYAVIDIHVVRTLPEATMVVLSPEGRVVSTLILAFHEPLEYMPPGRWLGQFRNRASSDTLRIGREIHGITGATLTAHAITESVRKALAIYQVLLAPGSR